MPDLDWVEKQLEKRGPGERLMHAVPCKDEEGHSGFLAATEQRIWYFQKGVFGASEEYGYDAEVELRRAPFGLDRAMLLIDRVPFEMPVTIAEEFLAAIGRIRDEGATSRPNAV